MQDWLESKSILFSRVCVLFFALLLAALDLGCWPIVNWFAALRHMDQRAVWGILAVLLLCSVFGWIVLWALWKLLGNLRQARVFTEENVRLLQRVSLCCAGAGLICLAGCFFYPSFLVAAAAAIFMALIVRIVRNVFQKALDMKNELDLMI